MRRPRPCPAPGKRNNVLSWAAILVVTLLPLAIVVAALGLLGLERPAVRTMGGIRTAPPPDASFAPYKISGLLTVISLFAVPFLLMSYSELVKRARNMRSRP